MTSVTINDQQDVNQNQTVYNVEASNAYTLETQFADIVSVQMTNNETGTGAGTYGGYSVSGSQITFYVDSATTWAVTVTGRK